MPLMNNVPQRRQSQSREEQMLLMNNVPRPRQTERQKVTSQRVWLIMLLLSVYGTTYCFGCSTTYEDDEHTRLRAHFGNSTYYPHYLAAALTIISEIVGVCWIVFGSYMENTPWANVTKTVETYVERYGGRLAVLLSCILGFTVTLAFRGEGPREDVVRVKEGIKVVLILLLGFLRVSDSLELGCAVGEGSLFALGFLVERNLKLARIFVFMVIFGLLTSFLF